MCNVKMAPCLVTGSKVLECTSSVAQQAQPIVIDATETVAKVKDLSSKAVTIISTCIPAGGSLVTAVPCFAVSTVAVLSDVVKDITTIKNDVSDIIEKAPALKQEIQSCAAEVKTASANVDQLVDEISKCVDDYVSASAA
jgi:peptidoglycan hydrolase CwlO-like protein